MLTKINTETEIKLRVSEDGLEEAYRWLEKKFDIPVGLTLYGRLHSYFDTPDFLLADIGCSLRKSAKKYRYCLKYPVATSDMWVSRREIFQEMFGFPFDPTNPLHRATRLGTRLISLLEQRNPENLKFTPIALAPQLLINTRRKSRALFCENGLDKAINIVFDEVEAIQWGSKKILGKWYEVEIETNGHIPEKFNWALEIAHQMISAIGATVTTTGKYKTGVQLLKAAQ